MSSKSNLSKKGRLDLQISSDYQEEKKFRCEICDKSFTKKGYVKTHVESVHEGKKPFKCELCDYSCSLKYSTGCLILKRAKVNGSEV
jgi:uncharacterized Zn-finger protein